VNRVRGKIKIWTLAMLALLFGSSLMLSSPSVKALPDKTVSVIDTVDGDTTFGPYNPGDFFDLSVDAGFVRGVRAIEFTLRWDPTMLRVVGPDEPPDLGAALEGPFLQQMGDPTDPVAKKSLAGDWVNFNNLIPEPNRWVDGSGTIAVATFEVLGGGECDLELGGKLLDKNFNPLSGISWVGGYFWSPFPHVAFTWWIPTAVELPPQDTMTVTGNWFITMTDPDGDVDYLPAPTYVEERPVLTLDDVTGAPESESLVEGATMYYGDRIIFDASASYDLDAPHHRVALNPAKFKWLIRAGGVDKYFRGGTWYDFRYESGVELPFGDKISYTFPGDLPSTYTLYGASHLGFHDLTVTVTDEDGNSASYFTWIRIYRLCPALVKMLNIPNPRHSLSKDGLTMTLGGKVKNTGGTPYFIYDSLAAYLELARMIHPFLWARMKFEIRDSAKKLVGTVYSDAVWLKSTEITDETMKATWTIDPTKIMVNAKYYVTATAYFCGSGVTYGLKATSAATGDFTILE